LLYSSVLTVRGSGTVGLVEKALPQTERNSMPGRVFVTSAVNLKAERILTEDPTHGQEINGVLIENSFRS